MTGTQDERPALIRTVSHPDGRDEIVTADAEGLAETVSSTPALRDLHSGTVSSYQLDTSVLEPRALVSLLRVIGTGPEDPDLWPEDDAEDWGEGDATLDEEISDLTWVHRWAEVNDQRVTAVALDDGRLLPVLVDGDLLKLEVATLFADHDWASISGGVPMETAGGNSIGLLADGVLYEHQWGDFGNEHHLRAVGSTTEELGAAVADWVSRVEIDQTVALALEPIDPGSTLNNDERDALRAALDECGIGFRIEGDGVEESAREHLARGDYYRRTRDALAQPKSPDGEALFALVRAVAAGEDEVGALTFATWMS